MKASISRFALVTGLLFTCACGADGDLLDDGGAPLEETPGDLTSSSKTLAVVFAYQKDSSTCGPAATRIALSARIPAAKLPSESTLAGVMGTSVGPHGSGTPSVNNVVKAFDRYLPSAHVKAQFISGDASAATKPLSSRVRAGIDSGVALVANIHGTGVDRSAKSHTYNNGHYVAMIGYDTSSDSVLVADPSGPSKGGKYWMTAAHLANWIDSRGYVYATCLARGTGTTGGDRCCSGVASYQGSQLVCQ